MDASTAGDNHVTIAVRTPQHLQHRIYSQVVENVKTISRECQENVIAHSLLTCMQVERLDANASMSLFYGCLTALRELSKLRLTGHVSSPDALQPLASALRPLRNLQHLELPGQKHKYTCPILDPFCSTLQELTKMTLLNLKGFHVPSEGYESFESALGNLPNLLVLKLANDPDISTAHFPDLFAARKLEHLQLAAKVHAQTVANAMVASLQVCRFFWNLPFPVTQNSVSITPLLHPYF